MFENNGFAFDSAGSFFGESTTPSFENGFSNAGPSDGFFSESAFDENGFFTSETSVFGESASYGGGFTQFGSAFSESAFGEDGFSADGMFCEGDNSVDSDKNGDYIDKHKGENSIGLSNDAKKAFNKRYKQGQRGKQVKYGLISSRASSDPDDDMRREEEAHEEARRADKKSDSAFLYKRTHEDNPYNKK